MPEAEIDRWLALAHPHLTLYRAQTDPTAADAPAVAPPIVGYRGGLPSLPPGVEWFGESDFVAAVDCAALPSDSTKPCASGWSPSGSRCSVGSAGTRPTSSATASTAHPAASSKRCPRASPIYCLAPRNLEDVHTHTVCP
jgi:hypothetical protein